MKLAGKTAMVTGASRGLGKASAIKMAQAGADVVCVARKKESCADTVKEIEALGRRAVAVGADVGLQDQVEALFAEADDFGPLDILFNNAGFARPVSVLDMTEADWDDQVDTNTKSVFLCSQQAARRMKARGKGGCIVSNGSIAGFNGFPKRLAYCASKAAVHHMTRVMAVEFAEFGVRVNCVAPGYIYTTNFPWLIEQGLLDMDKLKARIPMGDAGQDTDIGDAVVWLSSEESRYVTGAVLNVDGGYLAYGFL